MCRNNPCLASGPNRRSPSIDTWNQPAEVGFDDLVANYGKDLQRYALWLTGDRCIAEDLVQDTLLRAWKSLDKLQNPKAVKGWLVTILRRENARRFERGRLELSDIPMESLRHKRQHHDTSTEAFVLRQAMAALPEKYCEPLVLQVLHGYSQKEIAQRLGLSPDGVGTRLFRARRKLRSVLEA